MESLNRKQLLNLAKLYKVKYRNSKNKSQLRDAIELNKNKIERPAIHPKPLNINEKPQVPNKPDHLRGKPLVPNKPDHLRGKPLVPNKPDHLRGKPILPIKPDHLRSKTQDENITPFETGYIPHYYFESLDTVNKNRFKEVKHNENISTFKDMETALVNTEDYRQIFIKKTDRSLQAKWEALKDYRLFLDQLGTDTSYLFHNTQSIKDKQTFKWSCNLHVRYLYLKIDIKNGEPIYDVEFIHHWEKSGIRQGNTLTNEYDIDKAMEKLERKITGTQKGRSGLVFDKVLECNIEIGKTKLRRGGTYIELPAKIKATKAVLNIQNKDNKCFKYCMMYHYYKNHDKIKSKPERVTPYKKLEDPYNFKSIEYPTTLKQIDQFSKDNNLTILVFHCDKNESITQLFKQKSRSYKDVVTLLYYEGHYCYIKDFNRMMHHKLPYNQKRVHYCFNCLNYFYKEELFNKHIEDCNLNEPTKCVLPNKTNNIVEFTRYNNKNKFPYVIYADFESNLEPMEHELKTETSSYTVKTQEHKACSYGFLIATDDPHYTNKNRYFSYLGPDAIKKFINKLDYETVQIQKRLKNVVPMKLTPEEEEQFKNETICYICEKELGTRTITVNGKDKQIRNAVRDHDHITGKYRGCAHNGCNLNFQNRGQIPIVFHNLRGYDAHLIMQEVGNTKKNLRNVICQNSEKYMLFSINGAKFLDSLNFLNASLDTLVKNLADDTMDRFHYLKQSIDPSDIFYNEKLEVLKKKGVYPYDYMTGFDVYKEKQLPNKKAFYNSLTETHISEEDYERAQYVWNLFNMKTLKDYHDLYLKTDVFLLADVFENFRRLALENYKLDPVHYVSLPSYSWDALFLKTNAKPELITDPTMYNMVEKGKRGGVSFISKRYAKANNKYMKSYDKSKPSTYIQYLDANNLYGWGMCQPLPYSDFKFVNGKLFDKLQDSEEILGLDPEGTKGYMFEIDLEYPDELHDLHTDYPVAPESRAIDYSELSKYAKDKADLFNLSSGKTKKLVPTLYKKTKYVCHFRNLRFYIQQGLKVTKIHRIIEFTQKAFMKPYIEFNTSMRAKARNDFEKDFYKLMNNSVFGKTMENVRNRSNLKLCTNDKLEKMISSPLCKGWRNICPNLTLIDQFKKNVTLDKPVQVGVTILELSKVLMYEFHYKYIKKQYGSNATLLFTDTDSLTYEIKTEDLYKDMYENQKRFFDMSNYPKQVKDANGNVSFEIEDLNINKKQVGYFKDETAGIPIVEFVGLKSKMYSNLLETMEEKKTCKGIKKNVKDYIIRHEDYKRTLLSGLEMYHEQKGLRSYNHKIYTIQSSKKSLSCFDDKKYLLDNGIDCYAYGHYKLKQ